MEKLMLPLKKVTVLAVLLAFLSGCGRSLLPHLWKGFRHEAGEKRY